jgi:nicotinamidase-related amidase
MLDEKNCCLVVIDVQGKLADLMHEKEQLFKNLRILIQAANILDIPILWYEQKPEALGPTVPQIAELLTEYTPHPKTNFSCCSETFYEMLEMLDKDHVILCGIESHICVYQTAADLMSTGREVDVVADAVSSRTPENKHIALERMRDDGANISCVEMALFELLGSADHPKFREIAKLIK